MMSLLKNGTKQSDISARASNENKRAGFQDGEHRKRPPLGGPVIDSKGLRYQTILAIN